MVKKSRLPVPPALPGKKKSPLFNQPQKRYAPAAAAAMTRDELAAWRKEERRRRNRESAAASRGKTRSRLEELRGEAARYRAHFEALRGRMGALERHAQHLAWCLGGGPAPASLPLPGDAGPPRQRASGGPGASDECGPARAASAFELAEASGPRDPPRGRPLPPSSAAALLPLPMPPLPSANSTPHHPKPPFKHSKHRGVGAAENSIDGNTDLGSGAAMVADSIASLAPADIGHEGSASMTGAVPVADSVVSVASASVSAGEEGTNESPVVGPVSVFDQDADLFADSVFQSSAEDDDGEAHFLDLLVGTIGEFDPYSLDLVCAGP